MLFSLSRVSARAASAVSRATAARASTALSFSRSFSSAAEDAATADVTKFFLEHDAKLVAVDATSLPLKVAGRIGEHLAELYAAGQKGKNFDKIVKDLEGVSAAVKAGGLVVDRFFSTANYSPVECKKVVALLLSAAEPLASFKDIKDEDVREILVDNEANLAVWLGVRKALAALSLTDAVKATLEKLAAEGRLERVKKLAAYAAELKAVTLKTTDAIVTSAVPLSKAQQEAVTKALPAYAPAGITVNPVFTVDSAVTGGLTITLKNVAVDLSANSRLVEVVSAHA